MKGFAGKLLKIDLTKNEILDEPLDESIAENYLGGTGYCVKYLYDKINKDTDPLSPENILMIMNGPLAGSTSPTNGRFVACAKSPLTGFWGESMCGGTFGPELKKAGYDGIILIGASEKPVYLEITDNGAQLKDASDLWGKGIHETSKLLKEKLGSNFARIACIGQAGENMVKYAIIASEEKAAGRTGMGAVMGSKKLKAIAIKASKRSYDPADSDSFKKAVQTAMDSVNSSFASQMLGSLGTAGALDMYHMFSELPMKYWTLGEWTDSFNISGSTASEKVHTKSYPCFGCPIGCAKKAEVKEGEYKTDGEVASPEYETVAGFGSLILNDNLESIVHANYLCNDYGIDTISGSSAIAFVYYVFNKGIIKSEDIDGLEPKWGDVKPALELIKKIAFREGIGDIIANGSDAFGKRFNISQDEIATVYGMEVPYHDLRSNFGMAVAYGLGSPRGPCHCSCDMFNILMGIPLQEIGIEAIDKYLDTEEMAIYSARAQDYRCLYSSLIICEFANPLPSMVADLIQTSTGIPCDIDKLKLIAERIYTIKRLFSLKMGITPAHDRLPEILLKPLEVGGSAGKTPNFNKLKEFYYKYRQWDMNTGKISQKKLTNLGLNNL